MSTDLNRAMPAKYNLPEHHTGILSNSHLWQARDISPAASAKAEGTDWPDNPIMAWLQYTQQVLQNAEETIARQARHIEELEAVATHDELTGICNRRGFMEAFSKECDRTNRGHSEGGLLVMIDLDNFKTINDTYGHQAGDAALRAIAKALNGNIRTMDYCARLGGDEFVILFTNTALHKVLTRAQNIIKQLNDISIVWYGAEIPVRASLGLQEYKAGDTVEEIFTEADIKMYEQKRLNRTSRRDPGAMIPA